MATLYVTEYTGTGSVISDVNRNGTAIRATAQAPEEPENASQVITISGSSASSAAFGKQTFLVRIHTDAICSIKIGTSVTATASNKRMVANQTEYFAVQPGFQVAVITNV